jgi:hypothetical protein
MAAQRLDREILDPQAADFYRHALTILTDAQIPSLLGGAYAFHQYTGIARHTKDLDIFIYGGDIRRALAVLAAQGCHTELTYPHWLGKAYRGDLFVDFIFSSMNGVEPVDDVWFANATTGVVLGLSVQICPVEEMIWQKAFIMERERYDGADVAHLLRARGRDLDWDRLLDRFGPHWPVLLSHCILAAFIYPGDRPIVPDHIMSTLLKRMRGELATPEDADNLCQGTLLSLQQYMMDIDEWGYEDARLTEGFLTQKEVATLNDVHAREQKKHQLRPLAMLPICDHDDSRDPV